MGMTAEEKLKEEYHESTVFNGQYHRAEWVQSWVSAGADNVEPPEGCPVVCAICGRPNS